LPDPRVDEQDTGRVAHQPGANPQPVGTIGAVDPRFEVPVGHQSLDGDVGVGRFDRRTQVLLAVDQGEDLDAADLQRVERHDARYGTWMTRSLFAQSEQRSPAL
jgi:hypothetical protein